MDDLHEEVEKVSNIVDKDQNDINDTILLNEAYCSRVNILITEDKKIHQKAEMLGIANKVFRINSFIERAIAKNPSLVDYNVLSVKKEYFGNIKIEDVFFDSFKTDYIGFSNWFNKKAEEISYICSYDNNIKAFLFVKKEEEDENYNDITPAFPTKKRLKIGTFKVTANGFKLGERFLKIIFDNALKFKVEEIYVTIFDKRLEQQLLIELLLSWGFYYWGNKTSASGTEKVYVRPFKKPADKNNPRSTFPFLSRDAKVYMVPIKPEYHTDLFPDSILQTESELDFIENEPHRNAIKKVYVSHSGNRNLYSGDILVFYRTGGYYKSVVTTIGIVEKIEEPQTIELLKEVCNKRTVFSDNQLVEYWERYEKKGVRPFVVNFLYAFSLPNPFKCNLKRLIEIGVIKDSSSAPRGFTEISWDLFNKLYKAANE